MVDSHVLVGSCAQVGARVHLSAGVTLGGVLEPAGARPVIVEDDAFVGAGSSLLEGVLVGAGAVIGAGVVLTGTSRLYDLVRGRLLTGSPDAPLAVPPGAVVVPGSRSLDGDFAREHGLSVSGRAAGQGPRRRHGRPARPGGRPAMTTTATRPGILRDGRLGGADPEALAMRFGTPYYAYDLDVVTAQVEALRAVLPASFDLAFAVKANPLLARPRATWPRWASARTSRPAGSCGTSCAPGSTAAASCSPAPESGTRSWRLQSRQASGWSRWSRAGELGRLAAIAASRGRRQPVLLRLSMSDARREERVRIIGDDGAGKFGMDLDDLRAAAADAVASPHLEPLGIHAFGASNVLDAEVLAAHVESTVETAAVVASEAGFPLRLVDAGGGLGIPYGDGETRPRPRDAGRAARGDRRANGRGSGDRGRAGRDRARPVPRRAASGAYVARVVERKTVDGTEVAILDGGIHHVLRPTLVGQAHRVVALTGAATGPAPGTRARSPSRGPCAPGSTSLPVRRRSAGWRGATSLPCSTSGPTAPPSRCRCSCRTRCRPRSCSVGACRGSPDRGSSPRPGSTGSSTSPRPDAG